MALIFKPKWEVFCDYKGCNETAYSSSHDEKIVIMSIENHHWKKIANMWFCPKHGKDYEFYTGLIKD